MIDEIDYFPKKKSDSGWDDLKKQKTKQDENSSDEPSLSEKKPHKKKRN